MKAVITVIGKDMVGIIAKVSAVVADANVNIVEITQSVLQDYFAMIMLVDVSAMTMGLDELKTAIEEKTPGMQISVMHEDVFESMHHI